MPSGVPLGIPEFLLGVGVLLLLTERSFQGVSGSLKQVCLFYPHPQQLPGWGVLASGCRVSLEVMKSCKLVSRDTCVAF